MKTFLVTVAALFLFFTTSLRAQNVVFVFSAPEGEEILKLNDALHEKTVDFYVTGLKTVDEVSALVQKITAMSGVKVFTISETETNGQREAHGAFEACGSHDFFKKLLTDAGITDLIINGEPLKTAELHKVWKSLNQPDSPTNPTHDVK